MHCNDQGQLYAANKQKEKSLELRRLPDLPPVSLSSLKCKVEGNSNHQGPAQERGAPVVVELSRLAGSNRAASVNVDTNGIAQTHDGHEGENTRHNERGFGRLASEVEQRCGNGANVN